MEIALQNIEWAKKRFSHLWYCLEDKRDIKWIVNLAQGKTDKGTVFEIVWVSVLAGKAKYATPVMANKNERDFRAELEAEVRRFEEFVRLNRKDD